MGGGVRAVEDVRKLLLAGADKASMNSAAVHDPDLIDRASGKYGSQCIVVNIDPKRIQKNGKEVWEVQLSRSNVHC